MIDFAEPQNFLWLWLLPVAIGLIIVANRRRLAAWRVWIGQGIRRGQPHLKVRRVWIKGILFTAALASLIVAMAQPRLGYEWTDAKKRGVDIAVAVDVSSSMWARDVKPSRMERAKREVRDLLGLLEGDRVSLVAFAGDAYIQCPLTADYSAVEMFIDFLDPGLVQIQGTDLARALDVAVESLTQGGASEANGRAVILITDGEDNEGKAQAKAKQLKAQGVTVYAMSIGTPQGGPIPLPEGGFKKDKGGGLVVTRPRETDLRDIALATEGVFVRSIADDRDWQKLYTEGLRQKLVAQEYDAGRDKIWHERYQWPLAFAFALLLFEFFTAEVAIAALLTLMLWTPKAEASSLREAHSAYEEGDYEKSAEKFLQAEIDDPDNHELIYNRGVADYRAGNFDRATEAFTRSAESDNQTLQEKSLFNRGNSQTQKQKFAEAIKSYEQVLELNKDNQRAKDNLEAVKKLLEMQKQQQQQQQNQDQQDQNEQQDDQQQQEGQQNQSQPQDGEQQQQQDGQQQAEQDQQQDGQQSQPQDSGDEQKNNQQNQADKGEEEEEQQQQQQATGDEDSPEEEQSGEQVAEGDEAPEAQNLTASEAQKLLESAPDMAKYQNYRPRSVQPIRKEKDW